MKKALYVFLCSLLGILLFVTLERSLLFIYITVNDVVYNMSMTTETLALLNAVAVLIFGFIGGWYGTSLGLYWYKLVYEDGERAGLVDSISARIIDALSRKDSQPKKSSASVPSKLDWPEELSELQTRANAVRAARKKPEPELEPEVLAKGVKKTAVKAASIKKPRKVIIHG